jgi:hypothetical protein
MILPGLIPLVFYKRKPRTNQLAAGFSATVVLAALLGCVSLGGPLGVVGSIVVAIVGAIALYVGIMAWLYYRYYPKLANLPTSVPLPASP